MHAPFPSETSLIEERVGLQGRLPMKIVGDMRIWGDGGGLRLLLGNQALNSYLWIPVQIMHFTMPTYFA
jgi:hypothetical protein